MSEILTYTGAGETPAPPNKPAPPIGPDCPDAGGQEREDTDRGYLLRNGWYGVLRGKYPTGLWQRHDLPGAWPEQDAVALQRWHDRNSYQEDLFETRRELAAYRACLGHHRSQRARLWADRRYAQFQLEKLRAAITAAIDAAEHESAHIRRESDELREFYRILTEALENSNPDGGIKAG